MVNALTVGPLSSLPVSGPPKTGTKVRQETIREWKSRGIHRIHTGTAGDCRFIFSAKQG